MKRLIPLLLALALLAGCGAPQSPTGQESQTPGPDPVAEETVTPTPEPTPEPDVTYLTADIDYENGTWIMYMPVTNTGDTPITLVQYEIIEKKGDHTVGFATLIVRDGKLVDKDNPNESFGFDGATTWQPGETFYVFQNHTFVTRMDSREYTWTFRDDQGNEIKQIFRFALPQPTSTPEPTPTPPTFDFYTSDSGKDIQTLRYDADFEVEVADGVYWVPARALGESRYTNAQICAMRDNTPEEKQAKISTLYEALQLYKLSGFYASNDNIRIHEDGIDWEHHKPGYDAVQSNKGDCSTSSNWLRYILDGDYDEVGFMDTSDRDGSGHVFNYIKQDGWYYFIDLTDYRFSDCFTYTPNETGAWSDYAKYDLVLGKIHKAASVQQYVNYYQKRYAEYQFEAPGLMFLSQAENVLALDSVWHDGWITITYEDAPGANLQVVYDDPTDQLDWTQTSPPTKRPTVWASHNYQDDGGRDIQSLRHSAKFELKVGDGVYWVPARALGKSRYTNAQIYAMLGDTPEEKQAEISTLYEALQLYKLSRFYDSYDNIRIYESDVYWEHHKPGYDAVRTNKGECSASSNWLRYILDGDYEEVGFMATSNRDGNGHVFNYIKEDGWYYFIDMTKFRILDPATPDETGARDDYANYDLVLGKIHKAASVQQFVDFYQSRYAEYGFEAPGLMFVYTAEDCLALDSVWGENGITITYEQVPGVDLQVVYDDPTDSLDWTQTTPPTQRPDWSRERSYDFSIYR